MAASLIQSMLQEEALKLKADQPAETLRGPSTVPSVPSTQPEAATTEEEGPGIVDALLSPTVIGATAGSITGIPAGPVGMAVGAGAGGFIGATVEGFASGESPSDTAKRAFTELGLQSFLQFMGGPVLSAVGRKLASVGRFLIPGQQVSVIANMLRGTAEEGAKRANELFRRFGGELLPQQVSKSRGLDIVAEATEQAFIGGGAIIKAKERLGETNTRVARFLVDGLLKQRNPVAVGQAVIDAIKPRGTGDRLFRAAAKELYAKIDELIPQTQMVERFVAKKGVQGFVREMAEVGVVPFSEVNKLARDEATERALSIIPSRTGESIMNTIRNFKDDFITFEQAQNLRSDITRGIRLIAGDPESRIKVAALSKISQELTKTMKTTATKFGEEAVSALDQANKFFARGAQSFNDKFILNLAAKDPELVMKTLLQPGRVTGVRKLADLLDGDFAKQIGFSEGGKLLDKIRNETVRTLVTTAEKDGVFNGNTLMRSLENLGAPSLRRLLTRDTLRNVKSFARGLQLQQLTSRTPGAFAQTLRQPGALLTVAQGAAGAIALSDTELGTSDVVAATIIFGPTFVARMLTNPAAARILNQAIITPVAQTTKAARVRKQLLEAARVLSIRTGVKFLEDEGGTLEQMTEPTVSSLPTGGSRTEEILSDTP